MAASLFLYVEEEVALSTIPLAHEASGGIRRLCFLFYTEKRSLWALSHWLMS